MYKRQLGDDGNVAAKAFDDLKHVGGEEDSCAAVDHAGEHRLEHARCDSVDSFKGLVEEENFRAVDDGGREGELLLHAVREVGNELAGFVGELHEVQELVGAAEGGFLVESIHAADKMKILGGGEAAHESHALGNDADLALEVKGRCAEWLAEDLDGAA